MTHLLALLLAASSFSVKVHGKGPAMILIPGLACSGEVWNGAVARYQGRYELHVLTLAGFAGLARVEGPLFARARDDLAAYVRERRLDKPVVIGHSLGGFLALSLAAQEPDLVGKVVTVDGAPFLPALLDLSATAESARPAARAMRMRIEALTPDEFASQNRIFVSAMVASAKEQERVASWGAHSNPSAVALAIEELSTTDLRPSLMRIKVPVLLVAAGAGLRLAEKDLRERYEAQLSGVHQHRVVVARGARHFVMLDDPGYLFGQIDAFLGDK